MSTQPDPRDLLLPFHANGTLTPSEQTEIDAWLAQDPAAADEARALADIRRDMQAEDIHGPGEFGLARLMRDVDREQAAQGAAPAGPPATQRQPWLWKAVAAVALAALLGQVLLTRQADAPGFELAGAPADPLAEGPMLAVGFAPTATEGAIRALLTDLGLEIVSGPSALGLYRLRGDDAGDLDAAVPQLQAATGIVESVEHDAQ